MHAYIYIYIYLFIYLRMHKPVNIACVYAYTVHVCIYELRVDEAVLSCCWARVRADHDFSHCRTQRAVGTSRCLRTGRIRMTAMGPQDIGRSSFPNHVEVPEDSYVVRDSSILPKQELHRSLQVSIKDVSWQKSMRNLGCKPW